MKYFVGLYLILMSIYVTWHINTNAGLQAEIPQLKELPQQIRSTEVETSPFLTYTQPATPIPIFNHKPVAKKIRVGWTSTDVHCLALNIYFEARGEPIKGQVAVAHVVMNRLKSPSFPNNICDVVKEQHQFSWYWDGKSDQPKDKIHWKVCNIIAEYILQHSNKDITNGSTFYHANYVKKEKLGHQKWRRNLIQTHVIGRHIFYKQKERNVS